MVEPSAAHQRDDDDWAAALAGRAKSGTSEEVLLEAQLMRQALLRRAPRSRPAAIDEAIERRIGSALSSVVGASSSAGEGCAGCARLRRRWQAAVVWLRDRPSMGHRWPVVAGVAMVVALGAIVLRMLPSFDDPAETTTLRQGPHEVSLIVVADPATAQRELAQRLAAAGASVRRYQRLGRYGIDAHWPDGRLPDTAAQALQALGVKAPADGDVKVEFVLTR